MKPRKEVIVWTSVISAYVTVGIVFRFTPAIYLPLLPYALILVIHVNAVPALGVIGFAFGYWSQSRTLAVLLAVIPLLLLQAVNIFFLAKVGRLGILADPLFLLGPPVSAAPGYSLMALAGTFSSPPKDSIHYCHRTRSGVLTVLLIATGLLAWYYLTWWLQYQPVLQRCIPCELFG